MCVAIALSMSGKTNDKDETSKFLSDLANTTKSEKYDLELRRIRKMKERKRLNEKIKKRRERMIKLATEMKTDEINKQAVCHEIETLDIEIANKQLERMDTE